MFRIDGDFVAMLPKQIPQASYQCSQGQRKQFESGPAIPKEGGSGALPRKNLKNGDCWCNQVLLEGYLINYPNYENVTFI